MFSILNTLKIILIVCSLLFACINPCFSEEKDLTINADNISYDKEGSNVEATGSVEAYYKDLRIFAKHMIYNTKERRVFTDRGFTLFREKQKIIGTVIHYNIDTKTGTAEDVSVDFKGVHLKGSFVELKPNEIYLKNASFTSCGLPGPHYHISSYDIRLYTDTNWVIASWGLFWLNGWPVFPVPTYIYIVSPTAKEKNIAPVPEVGSNDVDGGYIHERLAWHRGNNVYGRYTLSYASKKGIGGGIDGNYIIDDSNEINARIYTLGKDGAFGGMTIYRYFGPVVSEPSDDFLGVFSSSGLKKYELSLNLSYRERINYERICLLPEITLKSNKDKLFHPSLSYDFQISTAAVSEESSGVKTGKSRLNIGLSHQLDLGFVGKLYSGLELNDRWYGTEPIKWLQILEIFDIKKEWNKAFQTSIGYSHFIENDGNSPFVYEMYRFSPLDEARGSFLYKFGENSIKVAGYYTYPDYIPKDIDYTLALGLHCYDIIITYRALRHEFGFGFNLGSR